jgi:hypothetical protein
LDGGTPPNKRLHNRLYLKAFLFLTGDPWGAAVVLVVRIVVRVLVVGTLGLSGGCASVGPIAIDQGRQRYNHIIQETSKQQTFANIIRVYLRDPTTFMDVTEVDASTTFSGTASGGLSSIGAIPGTKSTSAGTINGEIGNVAGGITYTESPLIRYQPLLGQALVGQLATPVTPDAMASLYDSSWGVIPLLDLSTSVMALDDNESIAAMSAIGYLDRHGDVLLVAEKSELTKGNDSTASGPIGKSSAGNVTLEVTNKAASTGAADALVIYYKPRHPDRLSKEMWNRLLSFYDGTQARPAQKPGPMCAAGGCVNTGPDRIELRTKPVTRDKMISAHLTSGAPLMRTYSALGLLKAAMESPHPIIGVIDRNCYDMIREHSSHLWNDSFDKDFQLNFFTLLPDEEPLCGVNVRPLNSDYDAELSESLKRYAPRTKTEEDTPFVYAPSHITKKAFVAANYRLKSLRRYILIIQSDSPPPADAYVSYLDHGKWYYIEREDQISQKNFQLVTLFLTIMAVPGATQQPLTPAITVGGG